MNSSVLFPILNLSHQIQNVHVHTTAYIHLFQAGSLQILVGQITVGEIKIMEPHVSVQHLWIPLAGSREKKLHGSFIVHISIPCNPKILKVSFLECWLSHLMENWFLRSWKIHCFITFLILTFHKLD